MDGLPLPVDTVESMLPEPVELAGIP